MIEHCEAGQRVRVTSGPYAGNEGEVTSAGYATANVRITEGPAQGIEIIVSLLLIEKSAQAAFAF